MVTKSTKSKLLVILGPTSTGKTDLALNLAKRFNGEIVACDSRQVYKGLDIGTGKIPSEKATIEKGKEFWKINGVKVWMYNVVNPKKQYNVADYVKDTEKAVDNILKREKLPIIAGGTGLYFKALLEGLPNLDIPVDKDLREQLNTLSLRELQEKIKKLDKKKWQRLNESDRQNPRRLIRQIELIMMYPYRREVQSSKFKMQKYNALRIGLTAPREIIYNRINKKVFEWIKLGIIDEVKKLFRQGVTRKRIGQLGLEYAVVAEYVDGEISMSQMIEKMQNKVRQYAKRQMTWFKKERNIFWFDVAEKNYPARIDKLVAKWYDSHRNYATKN